MNPNFSRLSNNLSKTETLTEAPPWIADSLTDKGRLVLPVILQMNDWAEANISKDDTCALAASMTWLTAYTNGRDQPFKTLLTVCCQ